MFRKIFAIVTVVLTLLVAAPTFVPTSAPAPIAALVAATPANACPTCGGAQGQDARFGRGEVYWKGGPPGGCRGPTCPGAYGHGAVGGYGGGVVGGGGGVIAVPRPLYTLCTYVDRATGIARSVQVPFGSAC